MAKIRIKAPDIDPAGIYMVQAMSGYGKWEPTKVKCTSEVGWLRGYVEVLHCRATGGGRFIGEVITETLYTNKTIVVHVERIDENPWEFIDGRYATLRPLDTKWVTAERLRLSAETQEMTKRLEFLNNLKI